MIVNIKDSRIAFATLFEARAVSGEGKPRFSGNFIIEPNSPNAKAIETAILEIAKEKWKDKGVEIAKKLFADAKVCYLRAPKLDKNGTVYPGFEGMYSLSASNESRPLVINRDRTPLTAADGKPYSGCYVNAVIDIWAQDNKWGRRINAKLKGVQFVRDGDAFGGGAPATPDAFDDLGEGAEGSAASEDGALF